MSFINLKKVVKVYPDGTQAIFNSSLSIEKGELVVFVGPSGCGKSTLLRMIAGLEDVTEGEIDLDGNRINEIDPSERDIAMVFQNYALYPHMSVYNNIAYGLRSRGVKKLEIEAQVTNVSELLQIGDLLSKKPGQLSGGQRQRVAMGRAIARDPKVFLFDEPLSNLDAKLRVQVRLEIKKLQRKMGTTSIFVTHDQTEAMTLGDRLVVMNKGVMEQVGTPMEIYYHPKTKFVAGFIGTPSMNFITGSIKDKTFTASSFAVPAKYEDKDDVILGVRPEDISITKATTGVKCKVELIEKLGSSTVIYCVDMKENQLCVSTQSRASVEVGDTIHISTNNKALHFFEKETSKALTK